MANVEVLSKIEETLKKVAQNQNIPNYDINIKTLPQSKNGFMGDFFFATLTNQDTSRVLHFAIKRSFDKVDENMKDMLRMAYDNETSFYGEVYPALDKLQKAAGVENPFDNIAHCYLVQKDTTPNLLVFEDLTKRGFELFDMSKLFPRDHLETIFRSYAKYHALSFVLKKQHKEVYDKLSARLIDAGEEIFTNEGLVGMIIQGGKDVIECFDPVEDVDIYETVKKDMDNIMVVFRETSYYEGEYQCLVHGDCWSNNMMFKYDSQGKLQDMRMLDFQFCMEGTPTEDLCYFFYTGSSTEDQNNLDHYLNVYYTEFSNFVHKLGEDPEELYPFAALKADWKVQAKYGLVMASIMTKTKLIKKEEYTSYFKDKEVAEMPNEILANATFDTNEYRKRIRGLVKHLFKINAF